MNIEHIAKGNYALYLTDREYKEIRCIAMQFHNGNAATAIRHIMTVGIKSYNDVMQEIYNHDTDIAKAMEIVFTELIAERNEDLERKFGSAISSND